MQEDRKQFLQHCLAQSGLTVDDVKLLKEKSEVIIKLYMIIRSY